MEFGKASTESINSIDFTLPPDGLQTLETLKGRPADAFSSFVGCAKWGRKEWVNMIYPAKTKEADFLDQYVRHFNSIELNAVFYSIPGPELIRKWKEKAEANHTQDFVFCPKFSRTISHIKRLKDAEEATDLFLSSIYEFGKYLGPCFLQMGDNFGPKNMEVLEKFLTYLPIDLDVFVEVRHEGWFADPKVRQELFAMLSRLKKGAVITDASARRDCVHMELPTSQAFIRFVGNGSDFQASDEARIDEWVQRLKLWKAQGLEKLYFFLHQHDEKDTPYIADYTIRAFNEHLGTAIPTVTFLSEKISGKEDMTKQRSLF
ncbi:hypothetical protein PBAL39_19315 [Pedobacter sp. BAL39]|uniref:DUF72 domain-containing protein n=1 Tax=Pedobacter sp. BAL39 TaxID=391596 RepID=UPI000155AD71|nr:DUF72 domain-containing protein [Pedobacter sp. BAL39]EDM34472.1 hypothetical protein PBAL39_19315 [Pedobacter sp. BAL39]